MGFGGGAVQCALDVLRGVGYTLRPDADTTRRSSFWSEWATCTLRGEPITTVVADPDGPTGTVRAAVSAAAAAVCALYRLATAAERQGAELLATRMAGRGLPTS